MKGYVVEILLIDDHGAGVLSEPEAQGILRLLGRALPPALQRETLLRVTLQERMPIYGPDQKRLVTAGAA